MAKLTSEAKAMFRRQLAIVATTASDGTPNVGPKGSMNVVDDETLAYSENTCEKTFKNLKENPKMAVMVVDWDKADGFQIKGTTQLMTNGNFFEKVARMQEERKRPRPIYVVRVRIEEIYSLKPGSSGYESE